MYPLAILKQETKIHPLLGDTLRGDPHVFDFSAANPSASEYETTDYDAFQSAILEELERSGKQWGVGRYLEERRTLLRNYPQMIEEGRVYHAGFDITSPAGTPLYAPIEGTVFQTGIDEGQGNYGGYVVLKHVIADETFYSFYGHLSSDHSVGTGQKIPQGEQFAELGQYEDSGGWFSHVHLQVHTEKSIQEGNLLQGYVDETVLPYINTVFPSPCPLFRY